MLYSSERLYMEELKKFEEILLPDERHVLLDQITGTKLTLEGLYEAVSAINLTEGVPEEIKSQFNVTRNLAIYTWFSYSFDPVVRLKTYILIEYALRLKDGSGEWRLPRLIKRAISKGWIKDKGFRHFKAKSPESTEYCETLIEVLPKLRNSEAHGSNSLDQNAVMHLQICADFINQLFEKK